MLFCIVVLMCIVWLRVCIVIISWSYYIHLQYFIIYLVDSLDLVLIRMFFQYLCSWLSNSFSVTDVFWYSINTSIWNHWRTFWFTPSCRSTSLIRLKLKWIHFLCFFLSLNILFFVIFFNTIANEEKDLLWRI